MDGTHKDGARGGRLAVSGTQAFLTGLASFLSGEGKLQVLTLLEDVEGLDRHVQDRVYLKCSMTLQGGGPLLD